jgi:hypothetical protein
MHLDQFEQPVSTKQINALLSEHFNLVVPIHKLQKKSVIKLKEQTSNKLNVIRNSSMLHESHNSPEYLSLLVLEGLLKTWMREHKILKEVVKCSRCDDDGWVRCSPKKCKGSSCKKCFGDRWRYCPKCNVSGKNVKVNVVTEANGELRSALGNAALNGIGRLGKFAQKGASRLGNAARNGANFADQAKTALKGGNHAPFKYKTSTHQPPPPKPTAPATNNAQQPSAAPTPAAKSSRGMPSRLQHRRKPEPVQAPQAKPKVDAKLMSLWNTIQKLQLSDAERNMLMNSLKTSARNNAQPAANTNQGANAPVNNANPQAAPASNNNQLMSDVASALSNQGFKQPDINNAVSNAMKGFKSSGNTNQDISILIRKATGQLRNINNNDGNDGEV